MNFSAIFPQFIIDWFCSEETKPAQLDSKPQSVSIFGQNITGDGVEDSFSKSQSNEDCELSYYPSGKLKSKTKYNYSNGKRTGAEVETYWESGKLKSSRSIYYDVNGNEMPWYTTNYDKNGNKIFHANYTCGKMLSSEEYKYDSKGRLKTRTETNYRENGRIKKVFKDGIKMPIQEVEYDKDGKVLKTITREFDADGVLVKEVTNDASGKQKIDKYDKVDGKIDDAYQVGIQDCYLLADLNAMAQSKEGRECIRKAITVGKDDKGRTVYNVNFSGLENLKNEIKAYDKNLDTSKMKSQYTITEEELQNARKSQGAEASVGDMDVCLIELAYKKLLEDGLKNCLNVINKGSNHQSRSILDRGSSGLVASLLGGGIGSYNAWYDDDDVSKCDIDPFCGLSVEAQRSNYIGEKKFNFNQLKSLFGADGRPNGVAVTIVISISGIPLGHALSVNSIRGNKVYLTDSNNPKREIVLEEQEFMSAVKALCIVPLTAEQKDVVSKMDFNPQARGWLSWLGL